MIWSRDCFKNFAVCRDAGRRAGLSATAELLVCCYWSSLCEVCDGFLELVVSFVRNLNCNSLECVAYFVCLADATVNGQEGDASIEQSHPTTYLGVKVLWSVVSIYQNTHFVALSLADRDNTWRINRSIKAATVTLCRYRPAAVTVP